MTPSTVTIPFIRKLTQLSNYLKKIKLGVKPEKVLSLVSVLTERNENGCVDIETPGAGKNGKHRNYSQ